jgi:hypothetical protein
VQEARERLGRRGREAVVADVERLDGRAARDQRLDDGREALVAELVAAQLQLAQRRVLRERRR